MATMQKIVSNLWFDKNAEEAVNFYLSVFKNSKLGTITYYGNEGQEIHGGKPGSVLTIQFWIEGQEFLALNGGPIFKFNEAVSFIIYCDTQEEIDYYWEKLTKGGDDKAQQCGWLKDKFGLSWQVSPRMLDDLMASSNRSIADKAMAAMLKMKKIDIAALKRAIA